MPIVLLAYQGSKLAEEKGGRLSSMVFFVYNRIDTQQKDKLGNILQILGTSLHEAFHKVSQLSGDCEDDSAQPDITRFDAPKKETGLFRRFKLDASNSSESDVRVMGNTKKNYVPPDDVPDPAYGKALCEFREHIHRRVTSLVPRSSDQQWKSRSLNEIFEYLQLVWLCIRSADFTLNFKTVVERAAFDQLNIEYKRYEKELGDVYYDCNAKTEKDILAKKQQVQVDDVHFDVFKADFQNLSQEKERRLDDLMKSLLEQPDRAKWKTDFEHQWIQFKTTEKLRWIDRLRTFFHRQLKYDLRVADCKKSMRLFIRDMFTNEQSKCWTEERKKEEFDQLFYSLLAQAKQEYPSVNVSKCIDNVYKSSIQMKTLHVALLDEEMIIKANREISRMCGNLQCDTSILKNIQHTISSALNYFRSSNQQSSQLRLKQEIFQGIVDSTQHAETYMDPLVDKVIEITIQTTKKFNCRNQEMQYAHIFAKSLVTSLLEKKQNQWESENSVSAKLDQKSTRQEMGTYFDSVSQGIKATELLVSTLSANLQQILPEGFRKEIIRTVDLRVRTKTWLSDPKALRARIDLSLIKLIDQKKVGELLDKMQHSASFYDQVLLDLIASEIPELEKEYESFVSIVKGAIKSAIAAASSVLAGKAKKLIDELNSQFLNLFKDNYLAMNLITDSDGYEGCDIEEEQAFREKCLQFVEGPAFKLDTLFILTIKRHLSHLVMFYMQDVRREDVTRPRCKVACPHCKSLCIHPANHDTLTLKHDTHHQPGGLVGVHWYSDPSAEKREKDDTLCHETCSMNFENDGSFIFGPSEKLEVKYYRDFDKVFPDWMNPKLMERLPLREYIFAKFQKAIAKKYKLKKCLSIPADYHHDLETIRQDLEKTANLTQDKYKYLIVIVKIFCNIIHSPWLI